MANNDIYYKGIGRIDYISPYGKGNVKPLYCFRNNEWNASKLTDFKPYEDIFVFNIPHDCQDGDIVTYLYSQDPQYSVNHYNEKQRKFRTETVELIEKIYVLSFTDRSISTVYYREDDNILAGPYYDEEQETPEYVWQKSILNPVIFDIDGERLLLEHPSTETGKLFRDLIPIVFSDEYVPLGHKKYLRENDGVIHGYYFSDGSDGAVCLWDSNIIKTESISTGNINDFLFCFNDIPVELGFNLDGMTKWIKEKCKINKKGEIPKDYLTKLEKIEIYKDFQKDNLYKKALISKIDTIKLDHNIIKEIEKECQENSFIRELIKEFVTQNKEDYERSYRGIIENRYSRLNSEVKALEDSRNELQEKNEILGNQNNELTAKNNNLIDTNNKLNSEYQDLRIQVNICNNYNLDVRLEEYKCNKAINKEQFEKATRSKIIIVNDMFTGVKIAEKLGTHVRLLVHPSPTWLSFENLYKSGFGKLFESALLKQDRLHILLIQNFNLTLPECWGYPLWNLHDNISNTVPFTNYTGSWPDNLIVIMSKVASSEEDDYGLPISSGLKSYEITTEQMDKFLSL